MIDFFLHLDQHLVDFVTQYGYWVYALLFAIVFCETGLVFMPFLPGDNLLFAAGAIAAIGQIDPWLVAVVLGSAAIAALMESRLSAHLGVHAMPAGEAGAGARVPAAAAESFSRAMGESLYLPAAVVAVGVVAVLFFANPHQSEGR